MLDEFKTEADLLKEDVQTHVPAYKVRALIEMFGREGARYMLLEQKDRYEEARGEDWNE